MDRKTQYECLQQDKADGAGSTCLANLGRSLSSGHLSADLIVKTKNHKIGVADHTQATICYTFKPIGIIKKNMPQRRG